MSLKYKIPAVFAGLTAVLSSFDYDNHNKTLPQINRKAPSAFHMPDALRVNNINERFYKSQEITGITNPSFYALMDQYRPRVIETKPLSNGVRYVMSTGDCIERRGGTVAWRNNNPGCIRYSKHAVEMGATGKANGFAIFPDEQTGMRAIASLLRSENYCNLTIGAAIYKYAPPHENNTTKYIRNLCNMVGVSKNTKIHTLNDEQMEMVVKAIRVIEGWIEGTEIKTTAPSNKSESHNAYNDAKTIGLYAISNQFRRTM